MSFNNRPRVFCKSFPKKIDMMNEDLVLLYSKRSVQQRLDTETLDVIEDADQTPGRPSANEQSASDLGTDRTVISGTPMDSIQGGMANCPLCNVWPYLGRRVGYHRSPITRAGACSWGGIARVFLLICLYTSTALLSGQ